MARERGTVRFKFLADARDLLRGVKKAEGEISGMAKRSQTVFNKSFSKITSMIGGKFGTVGNEASAALNGIANSAVSAGGALGVGMAAGAATAGAAIVGMAVKGIAAFKGLASEIRAMQRSTGANAEEASRLVAILNGLHIETNAGERAFFLLSKTIDTNSKKLTDHGIQIARNADGSVNLYETLLNVRTAYRAAGAGAEGSAIAAAAFGRSAQTLLPLLGATRDRLNEIDEAARKHHEFLTQDQIDKAKALGIAQTELSHAIEGVSIELGSTLVPAATDGAKALTEVIETVDGVGGAIAGAATHVGGLRRLFDTFGGSMGPVGAGFKLLRGNIKGAALDLIPFAGALRGLSGRHKEGAQAADEHADAESRFAYTLADSETTVGIYNQIIDDTIGAHLKSVSATSGLGDALQTLADDYADTSESAGGAAEKVYTFQDAMNDQFDSLVDANEATLDYLDSIDALDEALHGAAQGSENAADAMDRLTRGGKMASDPRAIKRATDAAVKSAEREVDAMVESGQVADTAEARKEALRRKLVELQQQFPEVADAVGQYIGRLDKIPNLTTHAETATAKLSKKKKDLSKDIYDVIGKLNEESKLMKGDGLDVAAEKHRHLLDVLNFLKAAYPQLGAIIDTFIADATSQWDTFIRQPGIAPPSAWEFGGPMPTGPNGVAGGVNAGVQAGAPVQTRPAPAAPTAPIHITNNVTGDGLNASEVADLTTKRTVRALVGSRVA